MHQGFWTHRAPLAALLAALCHLAVCVQKCDAEIRRVDGPQGRVEVGSILSYDGENVRGMSPLVRSDGFVKNSISYGYPHARGRAGGNGGGTFLFSPEIGLHFLTKLALARQVGRHDDHAHSAVIGKPESLIGQKGIDRPPRYYGASKAERFACQEHADGRRFADILSLKRDVGNNPSVPETNRAHFHGANFHPGSVFRDESFPVETISFNGSVGRKAHVNKIHNYKGEAYEAGNYAESRPPKRTVGGFRHFDLFTQVGLIVALCSTAFGLIPIGFDRLFPVGGAKPDILRGTFLSLVGWGCLLLLIVGALLTA